MYTTNLRKVGGSVMLALPPAILELLHFRAGMSVGVEVDGERLVIEEARERPHYTLDELLSQCDGAQELSGEDKDWLDAEPVGNELV